MNTASTLAPQDRAYRNRIKNHRGAEAYKHRKQSKDRSEIRLVKQALTHLPSGSEVLDAPCGNGRMTVLLAKAGFKAMGADLSDGTLAISREELDSRGLEAKLLKLDMEDLDLPYKAVDGTMCFRFFHHLPNDEVRERVIGELARITRKTILISYMSPWSPTMMKRRFRQAVGGKRSKQFATTLTDLQAFFEPHGFALREDYAQNR